MKVKGAREQILGRKRRFILCSIQYLILLFVGDAIEIVLNGSDGQTRTECFINSEHYVMRLRGRVIFLVQFISYR